MDQSILSSRAVIGMYYARLENNKGLPWVAGVANQFNSDQSSETYPFLGQSPVMREWVGGRQAKGWSSNSLTVTNKHYEATLEIALRDLRRDKTGQIQARIGEFVDRQQTHWASLLSALIAAGPSTVCYDGQFFFDTDHSEGESGAQSNDITFDLSDSSASVKGSPTAPSIEVAQQSLLAAIAQILSFKDDKGEPMNENAREFLAVVPTSLFLVYSAAVASITTAALQQNLNPNLIAGLKISIEMNPRLNAWTDSFAVFRTDSNIKAFIAQSETDPVLKVKDENSEFAFDNDAIQLGVDAWRNVAYGYWQRACYVTLVA